MKQIVASRPLRGRGGAGEVGGPGRDLGPPGESELGEDVLDVTRRRFRRDRERGRDLPVCRPGGNEPRALELARTERAGIHIRPDRHLLGERGEKQRSGLIRPPPRLNKKV